MSDLINKPSHYQLKLTSLQEEEFSIDVLNILKGLDDKIYHEGGVEPRKGITSHYLYSAIAYIFRAPFKGTFEQDIKKAIFYLKMIINEDPR